MPGPHQQALTAPPQGRLRRAAPEQRQAAQQAGQQRERAAGNYFASLLPLGLPESSPRRPWSPRLHLSRSLRGKKQTWKHEGWKGGGLGRAARVAQDGWHRRAKCSLPLLWLIAAACKAGSAHRCCGAARRRQLAHPLAAALPAPLGQLLPGRPQGRRRRLPARPRLLLPARRRPQAARQAAAPAPAAWLPALQARRPRRLAASSRSPGRAHQCPAHTRPRHPAHRHMTQAARQRGARRIAHHMAQTAAGQPGRVAARMGRAAWVMHGQPAAGREGQGLGRLDHNQLTTAQISTARRRPGPHQHGRRGALRDDLQHMHQPLARKAAHRVAELALLLKRHLPARARRQRLPLRLDLPGRRRVGRRLRGMQQAMCRSWQPRGRPQRRSSLKPSPHEPL